MSKQVNSSSARHVMLLYETDDARLESVTSYITDALAKDDLAVYASVHADNALHISKITSKIANYNVNIEQGNLLILNIKNFYSRALAGDLEPFKDLKAFLEEMIRERIAAGKSGRIVVVADCADNLSKNKRFEECVYIERWWQDSYLEWSGKELKITVVCPHPSVILGKERYAQEKHQISHQHSLTVTALDR